MEDNEFAFAQSLFAEMKTGCQPGIATNPPPHAYFPLPSVCIGKSSVDRIICGYIVIAVCAIYPEANASAENSQSIELYCEGTDYASVQAKHILVSIDRANQQISITDPLRETPRVLKLIETRSLYKAHGDHLGGFINLENEKTSAGKIGYSYCMQRQKCGTYLLYTVDFSLNRQNSSFEYFVAGEIRDDESNVLLKKVKDWGIFKNAQCKEISQKF